MPKIRVLVVDDSVVMRRLITEVLQGDPGIEVVGIAHNGRIALQKLSQVNPDVVTMDVEMPELDGVKALKELRRTYPRMPVIMFSSLTQRGASATLDALAAGATDFVTKTVDVMGLQESISRLQEELLPRIRVHFQRTQAEFSPVPTVAPAAPGASTFTVPASSLATPRTGAPSAAPLLSGAVELLCIGSSTGGPMALEKVFQGLVTPLSVPVVLVQHMPAMFTQMMAERLNALRIPLRCMEATHGLTLKPGHAYVAPGGFHMTVHRDQGGSFSVRTNTNPPENSCRPAVDVLFRSAVATGANVLGVVLTGMGQDGLRGCELIREKGGQVVVQDQASSVVWGMPGAVAQAGLAHAILPIEEIAPEILRRLKATRR